MKTTTATSRACAGGWALLIVMGLAAAGLLLMASVLTWANENAAVTMRNSELFTTTYAAEAATEKVLGAIVQDDQNYGAGWVATKNASTAYSSLIPTASDSSYWTNYQFSGGANNNSVLVECVCISSTNNAGPPYSGLQYVGASYEIIANARNVTSEYGITATVGQEVILGQIPIFQFAIFYNDTMEIDPGAVMNISGTVHGNTNIYMDPSGTLTFSNDVSATGTLNLTENPLDPSRDPDVRQAVLVVARVGKMGPHKGPVQNNQQHHAHPHQHGQFQREPPGGCQSLEFTGGHQHLGQHQQRGLQRVQHPAGSPCWRVPQLDHRHQPPLQPG